MLITLMKRKRKEHLAGVNLRKFVGQKKSAIIKSTLKNRTLRSAGRARIERVLNGLAEYVADMAKDRPNYVARFFATWQAAVDGVRGSAERMLPSRRLFPSIRNPGAIPTASSSSPSSRG